jgi:hypothetical protein
VIGQMSKIEDLIRELQAVAKKMKRADRYGSSGR